MAEIVFNKLDVLGVINSALDLVCAALKKKRDNEVGCACILEVNKINIRNKGKSILCDIVLSAVPEEVICA